MGLDVLNRSAIWDFLERLRRTGMTLLLCTHYLEEAGSCSRISFMRAGRIAGDGQPQELVRALGDYVLEIETPTPAQHADQLAARLGTTPVRRQQRLLFALKSDTAGLGALQDRTEGGSGFPAPAPPRPERRLYLDHLSTGRRTGRRAAMIPIRALGAIIGRDLTRMLRQRGRLVSAMVRPMIWLLIIGAGFGTVLEQFGRGDYQQFMVPGVLCMVLLFGSVLASLSLVYDKESGVMRMLMIAPFPHYWIILARTLSAAVVGLCHAVLLMVLLALLGYLGIPESMVLFIIGLLGTALMSAALGALVAVFSRTLENFAVIMNFFIFPTFFLSGALYPIDHLPVLLQWVTRINPFSYGVDLLKHAIQPAGLHAALAPDFSVAVDLAMLVLVTLSTLLIACLRFSRPVVLERFAARLAATRRS